MDRYQRHSLIDWFDQEKLSKASIVVVGAGAVGNEVLKNLSLLGVGHITIVDFDKIEEHNLTRSVLFTEADIGKYKAEVAATACCRIDPNVIVDFLNTDFWFGLTLGVIEASDAVICCVDNIEARRQLNKLCLITGTDYVNTGIDSRSVSVELFPFSNNPSCACYECGLPDSAYSSIMKRYSCGWLKKVAYEEQKKPTTAITSSIAGALAVSVILNRLNNHTQCINGTIKYFQDTITLTSTISAVNRKSDCPAWHQLSTNIERYTVKPDLCGDILIPLVKGGETEIVLSEHVLLKGKCKLCAREQEYFESVKRLTDAVIFCSVCGEYSVVPEYAEKMSLTDFESIFIGKRLPCKFIVCSEDKRQIILEMEV